MLQSHTTYKVVHLVRHSLETHPDTPHTLILIDNAVGSKLTTTDTTTVAEPSKHPDRINISFYGHKRNPYQIKGASLLHSSTHAYAHTCHSQTQAEGGGVHQYIQSWYCPFPLEILCTRKQSATTARVFRGCLEFDIDAQSNELQIDKPQFYCCVLGHRIDWNNSQVQTWSSAIGTTPKGLNSLCPHLGDPSSLSLSGRPLMHDTCLLTVSHAVDGLISNNTTNKVICNLMQLNIDIAPLRNIYCTTTQYNVKCIITNEHTTRWFNKK